MYLKFLLISPTNAYLHVFFKILEAFDISPGIDSSIQTWDNKSCVLICYALLVNMWKNNYISVS